MAEWKTGDIAPERSGQYMTAFVVDLAGTEFCADVTDYFKKGEVILVKKASGKCAEERLYRALFDESLRVRAEHDGWYEISDDMCWEVRPDLWTELPEMPDGMKWYEVREK